MAGIAVSGSAFAGCLRGGDTDSPESVVEAYYGYANDGDESINELFHPESTISAYSDEELDELSEERINLESTKVIEEDLSEDEIADRYGIVGPDGIENIAESENAVVMTELKFNSDEQQLTFVEEALVAVADDEWLWVESVSDDMN